MAFAHSLHVLYARPDAFCSPSFLCVGSSQGRLNAAGRRRFSLIQPTHASTRGDVVMSGGVRRADVPDVLKSILERKAVEVAALRADVESAGSAHPIAKVLSAPSQAESRPRTFQEAIELPNGTLAVIAEIKRKSPSKGKLADIKDPAAYARTYWEGGAAAISVLTDKEGFGGTMADLDAVVKSQEKHKGNFPGPCPVLRKDFVIDEIQIAEAVLGGASAVLLIMSALGKERCMELLEATHRMGLCALVEVHDRAELDCAIAIGARIIGVNNRDLRTFEVSLETSKALIEHIPSSIVSVAESGIADCLDAWTLRDAGFNAILVGESLVQAFEESASDSNAYTLGYNQAKGLLKAFTSKGSTEFGPKTAAAFYGKGEGATESLGEICL